METFEKVRWITDSTWKEVRDFFSSNSNRKINKSYEQLDELSFQYGSTLLDESNLVEFYELYKEEIWSRDNAKVHDLIQRFTPELNDKILYLLYVRNSNWNLIWGWVWIHRNDTFTLWFKATKENYPFEPKLKVWMWILIDHMIFQIATQQLKTSYISFWTDRNGYGLIWSKPSLAISKLARGFLPNSFDSNKSITIDTEQIKEDSIIFSNVIDHKYTLAHLYISSSEWEEQIKDKYWSLINSAHIKTEIIRY